VLVAASVTVVAVALVAVPRLRSDDGPADRSVDRYTVQLGDTVSSVARLHATPREAIEEANGLSERSSIEPGSQIEVPHPSTDEDELPTFLAEDQSLLALRPTFTTAAETHDVPVALLESLAWQESAWDNDRIGPGGVTGIAQLDEATTEFINDELVVGPALDPDVRADNITLMATYLDPLLDETDGSWAATVAAYRLGLSASRAEAWDADTQNYITTVLGGIPDFEAG
jgi:soluble lytic murein transglycosylase-like protein